MGYLLARTENLGGATTFSARQRGSSCLAKAKNRTRAAASGCCFCPSAPRWGIAQPRCRNRAPLLVPERLGLGAPGRASPGARQPPHLPLPGWNQPPPPPSRFPRKLAGKALPRANCVTCAASGFGRREGPRVRSAGRGEAGSPGRPLIAPARAAVWGARSPAGWRKRASPRLPAGASYAGAAGAPGLRGGRAPSPGAGRCGCRCRCRCRRRRRPPCSPGRWRGRGWSRRAGAFREAVPGGIGSPWFQACTVWQREFPWKCSETVSKARARRCLRAALRSSVSWFQLG